ncbi:hypothetical protein GBAR_LOCUS4498 [Geodia barretti]|uniref:Uncharacterized protein n=1 Tax=Geodia barretti TaxID=519541 RepID=A0AA35R838_GEOBA|nr:hypothetical protein GBAR_LOCUS4498 [Geodia barretti]
MCLSLSPLFSFYCLLFPLSSSPTSYFSPISSSASRFQKISRSDSNGTLHDRYSYCKAPSGPHSSSSSLTLPGTGSMANGGRVLYTTALRADSTSGLSHSSNQFAGDAQDDSPFSHTSCSSPTKIRRTEIVSSTHAPSPTFGRGVSLTLHLSIKVYNSNESMSRHLCQKPKKL